MASAREMRLRIKSVKNISQVTRALEAVSAAKVRKAIQALTATRSYATKAWQVLTHITNQPGGVNLHPLLTPRSNPQNALVIVMTADRGLAGAYNTNVIRYVLQRGEGIPGARSRPIGQVFFVPREEVELTDSSPAEIAALKENLDTFAREKAAKRRPLPFGLEYSPHYLQRSRELKEEVERGAEAGSGAE